jgi:alanyl-tRNA synthetase
MPLAITNTQTDDEFLAALRRSPVALKVVADESERILAERQDLADRLAKLEAGATASYPKFVADIETAQSNLAAAEKIVAEARRKLNAAAGAKLSASQKYTNERNAIDAALAKSAPREIEEFAADLRAELDKLRKKFSSNTYEDRNDISGKITVRIESNAGELNERRQIIIETLDELEELRREPDRAAIMARIAKRRAQMGLAAAKEV